MKWIFSNELLAYIQQRFKGNTRKRGNEERSTKEIWVPPEFPKSINEFLLTSQITEEEMTRNRNSSSVRWTPMGFSL
jgi:hypothetical protein